MSSGKDIHCTNLREFSVALFEEICLLAKQRDKLFPITTISKLSGVPKQKIYSWINNGKLRFYELDGDQKKYIREQDLNALLEEFVQQLPQAEESFSDFEKALRKQLNEGSKRLPRITKVDAANPSTLAKTLWDAGLKINDLHKVLTIQIQTDE